MDTIHYFYVGFGILVCVSFVLAVISRRRESVTPKQADMDRKVAGVEAATNTAPTETGKVAAVTATVQAISHGVSAQNQVVAQQEDRLNTAKAAPEGTPVLETPEDAASWVSKITNKVSVILFLVVTSFLSGAEPLKPGVPYVPTQPGVALTLSEINSLKEKVERVEKLEAVNKEYDTLLQEYKKLKVLQDEQVKQMQTLDELKQESIKIYKESIVSYRDIIEEMRQNSLKVEAEMRARRRLSKWQRNLNFVLGFAAPILGARALSQLGR